VSAHDALDGRDTARRQIGARARQQEASVQARFTKPLAALAIGAAMIVGTVGVSAASVEAKGTKKQFCKAALKVGSNIGTSVDPSGVDEQAAAKLEKGFHKLEAKAPDKSLKKSVATMSDFFGQIADGDSASDLAESGTAYGKAALKFSTYLATKCVSVALPDISLPDISLPDLP
jgi:hypothetical protein